MPGWIVASILGWGAGWALGRPLTDALIDDYWLLGMLPGGALLALLAGLSHWWVLRRAARRAGWWLPTSLVGWTIAGSVSMYGGAGILGLGLSAIVGPAGWLVAAAPGALAGAVTGAVLACLRPRSAG